MCKFMHLYMCNAGLDDIKKDNTIAFTYKKLCGFKGG